ncbi:MAG: hypothetical protein RR303_00690 [Bacteroidales bacterium]
MEKLDIDYSMSRGKKATYLLLGSIHVLIGSIALIGAVFQRLHPLVICAIAIYAGMGGVVLASMFNRLHHYINIDDDQLIFKSNYNRSATTFKWNEIHRIILSPSGIRVLTQNQDVSVNMGILRFRDIRRIKNKIEQIATQKGISCIRLKQIRKK